jgi:hypothetical protein
VSYTAINATLPVAPWLRGQEVEPVKVALVLPSDTQVLAPAVRGGGTEYRLLRDLEPGTWFTHLNTNVTLTILSKVEV